MAAAPNSFIFMTNSPDMWGNSPFNPTGAAASTGNWLDTNTGQSYPASAFDIPASATQPLTLNDVAANPNAYGGINANAVNSLDARSTVTPGVASTVQIPQVPDNSAYRVDVPNGGATQSTVETLDKGNIGNIGPGDQNTNLPSFASGQNDAGQAGSNIGDMSFTNPDYGFGNSGMTSQSGTGPFDANGPTADVIGSKDAAGVQTALNQNAPSAVTGGASDTSGAGKPVNITDISNAGQAAGNVVGQNINQGAATVAKAVTGSESAAVQAGSGWISSIESSFTDLLVRFGLILLALIMLIGAFMLFSKEGGGNVARA